MRNQRKAGGGRTFSIGTRRLQRRTRETPPYKVIAVGLYDDQADVLDRATTELQQAGHLKANRSFVVQALVRRLQHEIDGLNSHELLQMFFDSYLKKPPAKAKSRETSMHDEGQTANRDVRNRARIRAHKNF